MALTREVGSAQLVVLAITLTSDNKWSQVASSDIERRGGIIYVDPANPGPVYLSDTEQHARNGSGGAPMFPAAFPPGFELGTSGGIWVYAKQLPATVYFIAEIGQATDHAND